MSNNVAVTAPVFVTSAQRKALTLDAAALDTMLARMIGVADADQVTPRMLHSNKDSARAGMGGKMTPISFVSGLSYLVACYANGQGKADALAHGLPPVSAHVFNHAINLVSQGKGVTALALRQAVMAGVQSIAALPSKSAVAKVGAVSAPLVIDAGQTVAGEVIAAEAETTAETTAQAVAETTAQAQAQAQAATPGMLKDRATMAHEFEALALALGIKLTQAQIKALALLETKAA